jgi:hypothetical protein
MAHRNCKWTADDTWVTRRSLQASVEGGGKFMNSSDVFTNMVTAVLRIKIVMWSSGKSSWLQVQRARVRLPALPAYLMSSRSGSGAQLRSYQEEKSAAPV